MKSNREEREIKERHTHRDRERQREAETGRHTDRLTDRLTDRGDKERKLEVDIQAGRPTGAELEK